MFTEQEILEMNAEEFSKNWKNNKIQESLLKTFGRIPMTPAERELTEFNEKLNTMDL